MPTRAPAEGLSRREFLKLSGGALSVEAATPLVAWLSAKNLLEFLLGGGDEVESPLRNWLVQITEQFTATATPESPLSSRGTYITEDDRFPPLENEFINWLVVDRRRSTVGGFMFLETHPEEVKEIESRTRAFGFFVQEPGGKNTLYPYITGPIDINYPNKSKIGVFAWAGNKRLPAEYVQLDAVALTGPRAQGLLPGVTIPPGNEVIVFGEPNPNQAGEILPHFYYFRDTNGRQDSLTSSLTFITPSGEDAVRISFPEGSAKLASLKEAAPEIEPVFAEIHPIHAETAEGKFKGIVDMEVRLLTDNSLKDGKKPEDLVERVGFIPTFINEAGDKGGAQALLHAVALTFYKSWRRDPNRAVQLYDGRRVNAGSASFTDFLKSWAAAQQGKLDWSNVEFQILADDNQAAGDKGNLDFKQHLVTVRPGPLDIAYVDPARQKNINNNIGSVHGRTNTKVGITYDRRRITLLMGHDSVRSGGAVEYQTAMALTLMTRSSWARFPNEGNIMNVDLFGYPDRDIDGLLFKPVRNYGHSAFFVSPHEQDEWPANFEPGLTAGS